MSHVKFGFAAGCEAWLCRAGKVPFSLFGYALLLKSIFDHVLAADDKKFIAIIKHHA